MTKATIGLAQTQHKGVFATSPQLIHFIKENWQVCCPQLPSSAFERLRHYDLASPVPDTVSAFGSVYVLVNFLDGHGLRLESVFLEILDSDLVLWFRFLLLGFLWGHSHGFPL